MLLLLVGRKELGDHQFMVFQLVMDLQEIVGVTISQEILDFGAHLFETDSFELFVDLLDVPGEHVQQDPPGFHNSPVFNQV